MNPCELLTDDVQCAVFREGVLIVTSQVCSEVILAPELRTEVCELQGAVSETQVPKEPTSTLEALMDNVGPGFEDHRRVVLGVGAVEVPDSMDYSRPQLIRKIKSARDGDTSPLKG